MSSLMMLNVEFCQLCNPFPLPFCTRQKPAFTRAALWKIPRSPSRAFGFPIWTPRLSPIKSSLGKPKPTPQGLGGEYFSSLFYPQWQSLHLFGRLTPLQRAMPKDMSIPKHFALYSSLVLEEVRQKPLRY